VRAVLLVALVAACGDNLPPSGSFEIIGHADLGARGMNSALAVAGDYVYVGSRIDEKPVLIVDVSDPAHPTVAGEIAAPDEGVSGISSRELRAVPDLNLLVVLNLQCSVQLHGCNGGRAEPENIKLYDITDRLHPHLTGTYPVISTSMFAQRSPHEMFLWRDPKNPARVLLYVTAPPAAPSLDVVDIGSGVPVRVVAWDPIRDGGLPSGGADNILHSIAVSRDGRTGYLSHQLDGLVLADLSQVVDGVSPPVISLVTPPAQALDWAPPGIGPHSAVPVEGKPLLVVTEEIYPMPFGAGCPWGHLRMVDVTDPTHPTKVGEFALPENLGSCANIPVGTAFTAHNATVTSDLALVTWYAGGLQAIDISDPTAPFQLAELRPEPLPQVEKEDPGLGGNPVEMWSYPVVQDGLIYVVDVRNGLYILRYHGRHGEQLQRHFLEGNSNLQ
jgi:hypothetical protein